MNTMADFLLGFIEWNKEINYSNVFIFIFVYFLLFWLAVSAWVVKDAIDRGIRRRFAVFLGLATFILSVPFLLLYLLARPHFTDELEQWHEGGVNVPIVNFVGEKGIEMSIELRVNPTKLAKIENNEMKISIDFDEKSPKFDVRQEVVKENDSDNVVEKNVSNQSGKLKFDLNKILSNVRNIFIRKEKVKLSDAEIKQDINEVKEVAVETESEPNEKKADEIDEDKNEENDSKNETELKVEEKKD